MNGILIVDKPADWTSHDVVAKLRGALRTKRIGHGGTLDPMATGVLPIFVGRATRAAEFCENADKEYIAGLKLGIVTDTQDITGKILSENPSAISAAELEAILPSFMGAQKQIPPMYSAIKKNGQKLYELARKGIEVERPARDIFTSVIELLNIPVDGDSLQKDPRVPSSGITGCCTIDTSADFFLRIVSSKGTYVRTICHDIGAKLGVGGTMSLLRRTRAGTFPIEEARKLDNILAAAGSGDPDEIRRLLLPIDSFFKSYPAVTLGEADALKIRNGASISAKCSNGRCRLYGPDEEFLALADVSYGKTKIVKSFFDPRS